MFNLTLVSLLQLLNDSGAISVIYSKLISFKLSQPEKANSFKLNILSWLLIVTKFLHPLKQAKGIVESIISISVKPSQFSNA